MAKPQRRKKTATKNKNKRRNTALRPMTIGKIPQVKPKRKRRR